MTLTCALQHFQSTLETLRSPLCPAQASVAAAEPGISLSDPDVFALDSLDSVFNSFGGQLFDTLRSREGLAYSVAGGWDSPPDHQGLFLAGRRPGWARGKPGEVGM